MVKNTCPKSRRPNEGKCATGESRANKQGYSCCYKKNNKNNDLNENENDLFTFGTNSFGALGMGNPELSSGSDSEKYYQIPRPKFPVLYSDTLNFVKFACGGMHTVALTADGRIFTWGVNDEGCLGRITSGTFWENEPDSKKGDSFVPGLAKLPGDMLAIDIVAGDGITFAIGADGRLFGCGHFKDEIGALSGFMATIKSKGIFCKLWKPTTSDDTIKKLSCGGHHAAFLTTSGKVFTFGTGTQGQLGRVESYTNLTKQPKDRVLFLPSQIDFKKSQSGKKYKIVDIECGAHNTFAITNNGWVLGWGLNNSSQLGVPWKNSDDNIVWYPMLIKNLKGIAQIRAGDHHTLALTQKGVLLSFGSATYGSLGRANVDHTSASITYPKPEPVLGLDGLVITNFAAGSHVSACTTVDSKHENFDAYFWGGNTNLQLANGVNETDALLPIKMGRTKVFGYREIRDVGFGGQHAVMMASHLKKPSQLPKPYKS